MRNTEAGHSQLSFVCGYITVFSWIIIALYVIGSIVAYGLFADNFPEVPHRGGILTGYFFLFLIVSAISVAFMIVIKNIVLARIDYYDDIKYIRDNMNALKKISVTVNNKAVKEDSNNTVTETSNINKLDAVEKKDAYCLYSKNISAYLVDIIDEDGNKSIKFSRAEDNAMKFSTRVSALEFASKNDLNAVNDFSII